MGTFAYGRPYHWLAKSQHLIIAAMFSMAMPGCANSGSGESELEKDLKPIDFLLGRDNQMAVRIPAAIKGVPTSSGNFDISFNEDELKRFLGIAKLPVSPRALRIIKNCSSADPTRPFTFMMSAGIDHGIRRTNNTNKEIHYSNDSRPIMRFGLLDRGFPDWAPAKNSHELTLPDVKQPFGFMADCGNLSVSLNSSCGFYRDLQKQVDVSYYICKGLLPYWREIDDLYFTIAERIIVKPKLTQNYRIGYYHGL